MRIVHLLRKLDPAAWGGTEMALHRLFLGLRDQGVESVVYCPRLPGEDQEDPLLQSGLPVRRFRAFVPVLGMPAERKRQLVAVGGNLMSFDLPPMLWREPEPDVIHTHTLGRIGGIARTLAMQRHLPFVITIHGGVLDLPADVKRSFNTPNSTGWEWGRFFGLLFRSHRLFPDADAIVTCNAREADLLREQYPGKRIVVQPHGVPLEVYQQDCRAAALEAFPRVAGRPVVLSVGRVDPVKNQEWLVDQLPVLLRSYPDVLLVLAGACTDEPYGRELDRRIAELGLGDRVLLTGGLPPNDPRLIGLLQGASVLVLPSLSETFGLVLLESWAAGTPVLSSRTSGATALIEHGVNGHLFDLEQPETFHRALGEILDNPRHNRERVERGRRLVTNHYTINVLAGHMRDLYAALMEEKKCAV